MSLSKEQITLISLIDQKVKTIIAKDGDEIAVMIGLIEEMPALRVLIEEHKAELDKYYPSHEGFYQYIKILEDVAGAIASGNLVVPK